ncbi:MAG: polysaccharide deacetylase family protein [Acidimicrobiia bacterium]
MIGDPRATPTHRARRRPGRRSARSAASLAALATVGALASLAAACSSVGSSSDRTGPMATTTTSSTSTTTTSTTSTSTTTSTTTTTTTPPWPRTPVPDRPAVAPVPVLSRIATDDPVVFLTIDDGAVRDPRVADLLATARIPATLFVNESYYLADPDYFARVASGGGSINSHSRTHRRLTTLTEAQQRREICGMREVLSRHLLVPGHLFRSPYGVQNATTQRAAASCDNNAILMWRATINNGQVQYQQGDTLRPGDIVLAHFRADLYEGLVAFLFEAGRAGLTVAPIEDYLPLPPSP